MRRQYDLVCFDMDGTLTDTRSSWKWIHDCLGVDPEANYRAYLNGEIDESEFMRRDIALWKQVKPDIGIGDLVHMFQSIPLVEGIQETIAQLEGAGMHCVIVSGGIDIAARMIAEEFGFEDYAADPLYTNPDGTLTGEGGKVVDLRDKGVWVRRYQEKYSVPKGRTAQVGNSFTDIPMFENSGMSIAFNPTDGYTSDAATYTVRSHNIADILDHLIPDDGRRVARRRSP